MEFPFIIEKAEKLWKLQLNIQIEYGDIVVSLLTVQDEYLLSKLLYSGTYEYEFIASYAFGNKLANCVKLDIIPILQELKKSSK